MESGRFVVYPWFSGEQLGQNKSGRGAAVHLVGVVQARGALVLVAELLLRCLNAELVTHHRRDGLPEALRRRALPRRIAQRLAPGGAVVVRVAECADSRCEHERRVRRDATAQQHVDDMVGQLQLAIAGIRLRELLHEELAIAVLRDRTADRDALRIEVELIPLQRAIRTAVQVIVGAAAVLATIVIVAPQIIDAVADVVPGPTIAWATAAIAALAAVSAAIARVMAIPAVDEWLRKFGAGSAPAGAVAYRGQDGNSTGLTRRQRRAMHDGTDDKAHLRSAISDHNDRLGL